MAACAQVLCAVCLEEREAEKPPVVEEIPTEELAPIVEVPLTVDQAVERVQWLVTEEPIAAEVPQVPQEVTIPVITPMVTEVLPLEVPLVDYSWWFLVGGVLLGVLLGHRGKQ